MKTLLIVDDELKICELLSRFFQARGFQTDTAQSGFEAIDKLRAGAPDLLLLDVRMPDLSGLDVLKVAKQRYPDLQVVMVSAMEDREMTEAALQLGACDYITKPLRLEDRDWARAFFMTEA